LVFGSEIWRLAFDYQNGWQVGAVGSHYEDLWSLRGQFRQLFFNGYHPVFPWLSFVVFGLCLGRLDLQIRSILQRMFLAGAVAAVAGFVAFALGVPANFFPADTLFILLGLANATWVIAMCLLICLGINLPEDGNVINRIIRSMGRLALSHYPGHVWLGIIPVLLVRNDRTDMSFEGSFGFALIYLLITGIAGYFWLKHNSQGPLEKLLRQLASSSVFGKRP